MDRADFRQLTIIETYAQLTRFVQRKQMTLVEAAKLAISMGDALTDAMTIDAPDTTRNADKPRCEKGHPLLTWEETPCRACQFEQSVNKKAQDIDSKGDKDGS